MEDPARMIIDVEPVAHLQPIAVNRNSLPFDKIRYEERNEFLRILIGAVGVGTPRHDGRNVEGRKEGKREKVACGLCRCVRRSWAKRIRFHRMPTFDVAIDFVGRDLQEPRHPMPTRDLEQRMNAHHAGTKECGRIVNRAIDMRFCREIDDRVNAGANGFVERPLVSDISAHERVSWAVGNDGNVRRIPSVTHDVIDDYIDIRPSLNNHSYKGRTDETEATRDEPSFAHQTAGFGNQDRSPALPLDGGGIFKQRQIA